MQVKTTLEPHNNLVDQAAQSADNAIKSTQQVANQALDSLAGSVQEARKQASPLLNRASEQASALAHRGLDAVRSSSQQLRQTALHATDTTAGYIKNDPIKAVLIAAATGAALMALVSLISRSRSHD
ncbi:MAG: hypothetical protein H7Y33_11435 [Cytophagales bacterium]|nr:hypothetical protein [Rhizobacter sp.]